MSAPRVPDWEVRLNAYLNGLLFAEHRWGKHDCALFAAGAVEVQTGEDFGQPFRGHYRSHAGSVRALRRYGAGSLEATIDAALARHEAPAFARRGDIVMAQGSLGICVGGDALFVGAEGEENGLVRLDRSHWTVTWIVGER